MAIVDQELLTPEALAEIARQIMAEHSVERIKLASTAKGVRLENLTVHRQDGEPWSRTVDRSEQVYNMLVQRFGELV